MTMPGTTTEILSVREAAEQRRSIRAFEREPIPHADLEEILDVVRLAPSAFNAQPWRFVVVETPEMKQRLAAAAYNQRQVVPPEPGSRPRLLVHQQRRGDHLVGERVGLQGGAAQPAEVVVDEAEHPHGRRRNRLALHGLHAVGAPARRAGGEEQDEREEPAERAAGAGSTHAGWSGRPPGPGAGVRGRERG